MSLNIYYNLSINTNPDHPENHDRIDVSISHLKSVFKNTLNFLNNEQLCISSKDIEEIAHGFLTQIYSIHYINKIKRKCNFISEGDVIQGDTYFSAVTYNEIIDNSIILNDICTEIISKSIKYAYALIRPPSHHSKLNLYNGFCIINHTYLTAKYLHDKHSKKILILDYDVHHGDGTQSLVNMNNKDEIYFVSMHCFAPGFYPGTGSSSENNKKVLNVPFNRGEADGEYLEKFNEVVIPYITNINPDILVISNGLDAHKDDSFQVMKLTNEFYKYVSKYLKGLDKPLIYILEGGYNPETIGSISEDIINVLIEV